MAKTDSRKAPKAAKIMFVREIERLYPYEWVVMEVTHHARRDESTRGRLIAHSPDRDAVHADHLRFGREHPDAITYVFYTTPSADPPEGVSFVL